MTRPDLIDALRRNYIAYFRLFHGQHGIRLHEDSQVAWIIANRPPGNHVLRSSFSPDRVDEGVDALLQTAGGLTGGIRWLLFPADRPDQLRDRLSRRGLTPGKGALWMFRPLHQLLAEEPPGGLRIERVSSGPGLRAWWAASARGFGMTQRAAQAWYDAYRRHALRANPNAMLFAGRVGAKTVTTGALIAASGIAGIYDVSTLPPYRGRGYASALIGQLVAAARQQGFSHAGLMTAGAAGFYRRRGFEVGYREEEYFWTAQA